VGSCWSDVRQISESAGSLRFNAVVGSVGLEQCPQGVAGALVCASISAGSADFR